MNKSSFLWEKFKDIQELIRFTDQKVSVILLFIALEITSVLRMTEGYHLVFSGCTKNDMTSIFIILFFASIIVCLFLAFKIIWPRFAKGNKQSQFSLYFGHIALYDEKEFTSGVNDFKEEEIIMHISKEIYTCSKILTKKLNNCSILIPITFLSFFFMLGIIIIDKL